MPTVAALSSSCQRGVGLRPRRNDPGRRGSERFDPGPDRLDPRRLDRGAGQPHLERHRRRALRLVHGQYERHLGPRGRGDDRAGREFHGHHRQRGCRYPGTDRGRARGSATPMPPSTGSAPPTRERTSPRVSARRSRPGRGRPSPPARASCPDPECPLPTSPRSSSRPDTRCWPCTSMLPATSGGVRLVELEFERGDPERTQPGPADRREREYREGDQCERQRRPEVGDGSGHGHGRSHHERRPRPGAHAGRTTRVPP